MLKFLFLIILFLRGIFYPFILILAKIIPSVKKRLEFEFQNAVIWRENDHFDTDLLFEVASEGELEQIFSIIEFFYKENRQIDILFASPAVERKAVQLKDTYPKIRIHRLPLISFGLLGGQNILRKFRPRLLILCRYDFYPEFFYFDCPKILVNATLLRKEKGFVAFYYKKLFEQFSLIIYASEEERDRANSIGLGTQDFYAYDFRIDRINQRLKRTQLAFEMRLGEKKAKFIDYFFSSQNQKERRFILGNGWPSDLTALDWSMIFSRFDKIVIVPHLLTSEVQSQFELILRDFDQDLKVGVIDLNTSVEMMEQIMTESQVIYLRISGILCELYQYFSYAYIGGGFERSIHSVLEPYLAGARVYVGGNISRSTEYALVKNASQNSIFHLNRGESLLIDNDLLLEANQLNYDELANHLLAKIREYLNAVNQKV